MTDKLQLDTQATGQHQTIDEVSGFWEDNVCGEHFINPSVERQTPEFFKAYREFRYDKEHHLDYLMDWKSAQGNSVLEIGLGLGADATRWATHAKEFVGADLTVAAVEATARHLEILGLEGSVQEGNAENLPFKEDRFDIVSSHGVLHHTPDTLATLKEVYRIVKPGGQFIVMFYSKNSFNYWARIQGLMRLQFLWNLLKSKLGGRVEEPWKAHVGNFKARGWSYFGWNTWPHHCTDGPECEIAFIRTYTEMKLLLQAAGFKVERGEKAHFPIGAPKIVERILSRYIGFYQFIWCRK